MSRIKAEMEARCELAMMGKVVPVNSNDEVQSMTAYMYGVLTNNDPNKLVDILENAICKHYEHKVKYVVCNRIMGMPCISYLLECPDNSDPFEEEYPDPFTEDYGTGYPSAFCYTFNTTNDWCSEFGDCFFEKQPDGYFHKVS